MTPTDPNPAREADGRADRITLAYILREAGVEIGSAGGQEFRVRVANHLIANRPAVLRALGLHEERDASGTLHRFVTEWEERDR